MGQTADQLQREIAEQRALIGRKLTDLERRIQSDMTTARARVKGNLDQARPRATDEAAHVTSEATDKLNLEEQIRRRPLTSLAGGFGAGVLLGVLSDRGGDRHGSQGPRRAGDEGTGILDALVGAVQGTIAGEVQQLIHGAVAGFREEEQRRFRHDGRPGGQGTQHKQDGHTGDRARDGARGG